MRPYLSSAILLSAALIASCESTTEIWGPYVVLNKVFIFGLDSADSAAASETLTLRFGSTSTDSIEPYIVPGTLTGGERVAVEATFGAEHIELLEPVIYPSPDVPCATDVDCAGVGDGFTCQALSPAYVGAEMVCGRAITLSVELGSLTYNEPGASDIAVGLYNGATMHGADASGAVDLDRASDPDAIGREAVRGYLSASEWSLRPVDVCVILWDDPLNAPIDCVSTDRASAVDALQLAVMDWPLGGGTTRGTWTQLDLLLSDDDPPDELLLVVDGRATDEAERSDVLARAVAAGTSLHFVVLDGQVDNALPELYPGAAGVDLDLYEAARATSGTYRHASAPFDLYWSLRSQAHRVGGGEWHVNVMAPALSDGSLEPGGYRLAVTMSVTLHSMRDTFEFRGDLRVGELGDLVDTRLSVVVE